MKPQPAVEFVGCIRDHQEENHICKVIQGEDNWFGNHFGCDFGHMMEHYFDI